MGAEGRGTMAKLIERFAAHEWPGASRINVSKVSLESEARVVRGFLSYGDRRRVPFETRIDSHGNILSYKLLSVSPSIQRRPR